MLLVAVVQAVLGCVWVRGEPAAGQRSPAVQLDQRATLGSALSTAEESRAGDAARLPWALDASWALRLPERGEPALGELATTGMARIAPSAGNPHARGPPSA